MASGMRSAHRAASASFAISSKAFGESGRATLAVAKARRKKGRHRKPMARRIQGVPMRVTPCCRLERVSGTHFNDAVSVVIVGIPERLAIYAGTRMVCISGVGQHTIAKAHFQVVIAVIERQQIVVQEVECCDPEFDVLPLTDLEALEQRDVAVP